MKNQPIKVLVVDDHANVRKGMKALLQEFEDIRVVGEAADGGKGIAYVHQLKPDVVLIDLVLPDMDGIEAIKKIRLTNPNQRVIVLTAYPGTDKLILAMKAGAMGYLLKDLNNEELIHAIRHVYSREPTIDPKIDWKPVDGTKGLESAKRHTGELSERELEVLRLLTKGKSDQEIADLLILGEATIRTLVSRILSKLGLKNRVEAAMFGIQSELVAVD